MKKRIATLLILAMALSLAACVSTKPAETIPEKPAPQETQNTSDTAALMKIKLVVVHADGTEKIFTYETDETYLGAVVTADGLVKGNDGPYGLEITEVDGEQAIYDTDKAYWALYEGVEYALQGIDTTPVEDGRIYKLVYTKG